MLLKRILLSLFTLLSLVIIIVGTMFIISQMINIKYFFDHAPINNDKNTIPICTREFVSELILYAKIIIGYAICGLILVVCYAKSSIKQKKYKI